jgi:hypothetical protein
LGGFVTTGLNIALSSYANRIPTPTNVFNYRFNRIGSSGTWTI